MKYGTNFEYYCPTHIFFGKGILDKTGKEVEHLGKHALLIYDGEWVKKTDFYATIKKSIQATKVTLDEVGDIRPNPVISKVNEITGICKQKGIDVLIALGGGSTIDTAKLVSAAANYDGDAWDLIKHQEKMTKFLPLIVIPTIAGTGSEMDYYGIVSNPATDEKLPFSNRGLFPTASFLEPTLMYSVSQYQTAAGSIDSFTHYLEVYLMRPNMFVLDRAMEGFMKSILHFLPILMKDPKNYEARANILWGASWALNGFTFGPTHGLPFMCHWIEDEVSARYNVTHGIGLAVILPKYLKYNLNEKSAPLYKELAVNVFGVDSSTDDMEAGKTVIKKLEHLFYDICNVKPHLSDYGVKYNEDDFRDIARIACRGGVLHGYVDITQKDAFNILKASL